MNKIITILLVMLSLASTAQDLGWQKETRNVSAETKIADKIKNNEPWGDVYKYGLEELNVSKDSLNDILLSLNQEKLNLNSTIVDTFFQLIVDSSYSEFPYRVSGNLSKSYYEIPKLDTSTLFSDNWDLNDFRRSLNPKIAELINLEYEILLPQLIKYLYNDAATRLCIEKIPMRPWGNRKSMYLSISDVALELIIIKTYCDFYTQYHSFPLKSFSNQGVKEKSKIIDDIKSLYNNSIGFNSSDRVLFYLNSISSQDYSFKLTCDNLLFAGDTVNAIKMYKKSYTDSSLACKKDWDLGETLLSLGERDVIEDCMNTATNYRCMDDSGIKCVEILLNTEYAYYKDELFAEIISTEPNSFFRKSGTGPNYIWHKILGELANYKNSKLPKTLLQLMYLEDKYSTILNYRSNWEDKLSSEELENFRVCDLALLKYHETIQKVNISNWLSINERNMAIKAIRMKYENKH